MTYKCEYFGIKEIVSGIVYNFYANLYGEDFMWKFFDKSVLKDLDKIRKKWGSSIIINNWAYGGNLSQCGLRSNADPLVKSKTNPYCSAHTLGKGFDLHAGNGDNKGLYELVKSLIENGNLNAFRRLENYSMTEGWVHVDSFQTKDDKLEIFS